MDLPSVDWAQWARLVLLDGNAVKDHRSSARAIATNSFLHFMDLALSSALRLGHDYGLDAQRPSFMGTSSIAARGWGQIGRRANMIADNALTENGGWVHEVLARKWEELLEGVSMSTYL